IFILDISIYMVNLYRVRPYYISYYPAFVQYIQKHISREKQYYHRHSFNGTRMAAYYGSNRTVIINQPCFSFIPRGAPALPENTCADRYGRMVFTTHYRRQF